jgi:hypothetical protein
MHLPSFVSSSRPEAPASLSRQDHLFIVGIAVGTAVGFVLGSIIAFRVGEERLEELRRAVERAIGHEDQPKFEFLLQ